MTTYTRADLVDLVLENLGVLAAGQTAQIEDTRRVDTLAPALIATLKSTEVYYLNDIDNIPEDAFTSLAAVVALGCSSKFGVMGEDLDALQKKGETGLAALKVLTRGRPTYAPLRTEFF